MKYLHELVMEDMPKEAQVILPELETLDFIRQGSYAFLTGLIGFFSPFGRGASAAGNDVFGLGGKILYRSSDIEKLLDGCYREARTRPEEL